MDRKIFEPMQIKFLGKEYPVKIDDLEEKTVGGLKKKIKEIVPQCAILSNDKILLFYNKAKISAGDDTALDEEKVAINEESTVFIVVISTDVAKSASAETKKSTTQSNASSAASNRQTPQMPYGMGQNMGGMAYGMPNNMMMGGMDGAGGIDNKIFEQALNNPDLMNSALEMATANASPEQKAMAKSIMENFKNNPEAMKQMMERIQNFNPAMGMNPMMGGQMGSQVGSPMMNNPMMGSPMMGSQMGSPMMNNPMMGNPMMNNPMMGNPYYNPMVYGNPYAMQYNPHNAQPPADGPCSHGFYPLKEVNGKREQQNAEEVYAEKLAAMSDMGFPDREANLKALIESKGDVSEAIDNLTKK